MRPRCGGTCPSPGLTVKLVFLGRYRELAGAEFPAPPAGITDLSALRAWLAGSRPDLAQAMVDARCAVVINQAVVRDPRHPPGRQ